ncbi:MAG: hypothetical protein M3203_13780 [Actinomycetota bacterium]|nr:hypothetical protein [Actinomycetota bacterium]
MSSLPRDAVRPVVLLFNARGDYLLNLPAVRALSHLFGDRLTMVCRPGARTTFFPYLGIPRVHEPPTSFVDGRYSFDPRLVSSAIAPVDLVLSLNPWHGKVLDELLALLGPASSFGFHPTFSHPVDLDFGKHSADLAFDIPEALDGSLKIETFASPPELLAEAVAFADRVRTMLSGRHAVVVHGETKPEKMWPAERFCAVVDWLLEHHSDVMVLDVGGPGLLEGSRHPSRIVPCGSLPLHYAMALVGIADLFIGVDSCFLHAADLFRVPGVGLFGPTDPHEFGFRFAPHRHANGHGTMEAISVSAVIDALEPLLEETRPRPVRRDPAPA